MPGFATADELLAEPLDAVLVAVPDPLHAATVLAAPRRRAARLLREAALLHRGRGRRDRRRARPGRPGRPGRLHEAVRPQLRGGARLPARGRRGPALHLGRGLRPRLVAVRRPPAAACAPTTCPPTSSPTPAPASAPRRPRRSGSPSTAPPARVLRSADVRRRALRERGARHARPHGHRGRARCVGGQIFADGEGARGDGVAAGRAARSGTSSRCSCPTSAWYRERYTLHFADRVIELEFPSPYLNNQQTDLYGAPLGRPAARHRCTCRPATRRRSCASWRGSGPAPSTASRCETRSRTAIRDARLLTEIARHAIRGMTA